MPRRQPGPFLTGLTGPSASPADRHALVRQLAATPGGAWITCAGPSMKPTLAPGDRVRVIATRYILPGDVILFETRDADALVLHRVVLVLPGLPWIVHVGDNGRQDLPGVVHVSRVIGRAGLPRRLAPPRAWLAGAARVARAALAATRRAPARAFSRSRRHA